ncbi:MULTISPECIES: TraB/GumN family protein [unclassified Yoonia]|uniref:TraB/GumN family protein n=1 Tax=unclassified Yoonia TaxID=2629118 RepID=UPI002AFF62FB|nr:MULTISPECIES: TraB/GumN family protein [unclassified Yoonia]
MLRRVLAATALLLTAGHATAQCVGTSYFDLLSDDQRVQLDAATADMPYAEGLIWDATRDGQVITVVGTMHIYDPRLEPIFEMVADDVMAADVVLLEATPDDQRALEAMLVNDPGMFLITEGPTLPDLLDAETWGALSSAASERGVPGFMAAQMQPWYLSLMLAIPPCAMMDLAMGIEGLDGMISDLATANDIPMQALESFTTLFEMFQTGSMEEQIDMLRLSLVSPDTQQQMFVAMLDSYFSNDVGRLWEMSRIAVADTPGLDPETGAALFAEMEDMLLIQRNRNWMPVIAQTMAENDTIVAAFGAAHLIGNDGVLQLLENDGWDIVRRY